MLVCDRNSLVIFNWLQRIFPYLVGWRGSAEGGIETLADTIRGTIKMKASPQELEQKGALPKGN
jgi:hypothetical protein